VAYPAPGSCRFESESYKTGLVSPAYSTMLYRTFDPAALFCHWTWMEESPSETFQNTLQVLCWPGPALSVSMFRKAECQPAGVARTLAPVRNPENALTTTRLPG